MFVYKYNIYTKKYYKYDMDDHDILGIDFDETLHKNECIPYLVDKLTCGYCNTVFPSRNKLFYHLGFMNIDITHPNTMSIDDDDDDYTNTLGEYGFTKRKNSRFRYKKKYTQKFKTYKDIIYIMKSLKICG